MTATPLVAAILDLVGNIVPVANGLTQGALDLQQARKQLDESLAAHQRALAALDDQLRGNDQAADLAAAALPTAVPLAAATPSTAPAAAPAVPGAGAVVAPR